MTKHKKLEEEEEKVELNAAEDVEVALVEEPRVAWGNKVEYLLACIGLAVGLGNVWRFPYLCHKHGGGAFLIPYFICLVFEGLPLMYLEMAVGQFFRSGSINCWARIHPCLKGIGVGCVAVSMLLCLYYVVIIARCFLYFFASFTATLPFTQCANLTSLTASTVANMTLSATGQSCCEHSGDAANYYWWRNVLVSSEGFNDVSGFNLKLLGCLLLSWVVVYACMFKGVESSGKAVYFTATFPYLCLVILFFRGVTLPGAGIGVTAYLKPDFTKLLEGQVWLDAATQIFFSLSLGFGALVAFASYTPYKNNVGRDSAIVCLVNCGTSVFAGFVIYSILGYREFMGLGLVNDVSSGSGLAFVAISEAVSNMDVSPLWSMLFFFMLILLGLDSEFGTLEGAVTPIIGDLKMFPNMRKEVFSGILSIILFICGIGFCSGGGEYMISVLDTYGMNIPILILALCECIAVGWVFGTDNMSLAIEDMQGTKPCKFFTICWKYISPGLLIIIFCITFVQNLLQAPKYTVWKGCTEEELDRPWNGTVDNLAHAVPFPIGAQILGWAVVIVILLPIPIFCIKNRDKNPGSFWKSVIMSAKTDRVYDMEQMYHRPTKAIN